MHVNVTINLSGGDTLATPAEELALQVLAALGRSTETDSCTVAVSQTATVPTAPTAETP